MNGFIFGFLAALNLVVMTGVTAVECYRLALTQVQVSVVPGAPTSAPERAGEPPLDPLRWDVVPPLNSSIADSPAREGR